VKATYVDSLVAGFILSNSDPFLVKNFNSLNCLGCLHTGGIYFKADVEELAYCDLCKSNVFIKDLHEVMTNAYRTKLIEASYNYKYPMIGGDSL